MTSKIGTLCRVMLAAILTVSCAAPENLVAQSRQLTHSELRGAIREASAEKDRNLGQVRSFFADPAIREALAKGGVDYARVDKAVAALDADALAKIAAQTGKIQSDLAAGALTNQELTYIVIALGVAVIVLIAVAA